MPASAWPWPPSRAGGAVGGSARRAPERGAMGRQRPGPRIPRCHRKADVKRFARFFPSLSAQETKMKIGFLEKTAFKKITTG